MNKSSEQIQNQSYFEDMFQICSWHQNPKKV